MTRHDGTAAAVLPAPDLSALARAVDLAALGAPSCSPNPCVGAVVLDAAGEVVGEGFHERAGGPHAEVVALAAAGGRARGGTVVVTLEPCRHTGRTGPCTLALLEAGIARVVVGVADPTAAGGGVAVLRDAGVEVVLAGRDEARAAERVNERWLSAVRRGRPHLTWKFASTLDGRAAAADGSSRWITSPEARADVHRLRATCDVVLAGVGTVLTDDPHLTVRHPDGTLAQRQPLRVVADTEGRTPTGARVRDGVAETWVATAAELGRGPDGHLDLVGLGAALFARGHRTVLLEGGGVLAGAFLAAGLTDRVVAYLAPVLLGAGPSVLGPAGIPTIAAALRLDVEDLTRIGPDLRLTARPLPAGADPVLRS